MKRIVLGITIVALSFGITASSVSAEPRVHHVKFSNCSALNKVYPGGVAKSRSSRNRGGDTHYTPTVNSKVYSENSGKDRDHDGIACER